MTIKGPFGYNGGWNSKAGPYDCPDNSYVDAQNMELVGARLSKKSGNSLWTTADHPGGGGSSIADLSYFQGVLVAACNGKVATASAATTGTWTDITGATTFPGGRWMQSLNNLLLIGQVGNVCQWTGSGNLTQYANSTSPNPPSSSQCAAVANNYMFIGNGTKDAVTSVHRVFWSAVQDPTSWPATNYVDVNPDESGHSVVALFPFGQDLLIFKDNLIARLYTQSTNGSLGPLVIVTEQFGIAGRKCVDRLPDGRVAFVGHNNHIYVYDGSTFFDISDQPFPYSNIQSVLNELIFKTSGLSQGCLKVYQAKNQIWITYPLSWTNAVGTVYSLGVTFIYDIQNNVWLSPYPDHRIICMVNYVNGSEYLIAGGISRLFREDSGDTNSDTNGSQTFEAYVTKSIPTGIDSKSYMPRSFYVPIKSGNLNSTLYYGANGYNTPASSASIQISGSSSERKKSVLLNSKNTLWNTAQFRFDGISVSQPFTLSPFFLSDEIETQV